MALIHAYRTDNGERVHIPVEHLAVFPGVFTTEPPGSKRKPAAAPAAPELDDSSDLTPPVGETTKENH